MKDVESFVSVQLNWDIDLDDDVIQETSCVMKPYIGVASDGVYKCKSRKELEKAFADLYQHPRYGGGINDAVLLQEYLSGTEYAVDTVSRNGETKILALWKYKKYPLNVAPFVYQCSEIVSSAQLNEQKVCEYCLEVLKAAGIKWGPTHTG
jgi:biotin carboxylase